MEKEGYVSIQAVNDMLEYCRNFDGNDAIYIFEKWFREQEPVQPKMGRWVRMSDLSEDVDDRYKCSKCGNVVHSTNRINLYTFHRWCGRCGSNNDVAKMQEVRNESSRND